MAGEVYLIMGWMGHPVTYVEAVIFESLGQTVRMAGFIVPAGLGIQEGALTLIGAALGVSPAACLSLSVGKRLRECLVGGPALLGWFLMGGKSLRSSAFKAPVHRFKTRHRRWFD